jgi:hypothetical protein
MDEIVSQFEIISKDVNHVETNSRIVPTTADKFLGKSGSIVRTKALAQYMEVLRADGRVRAKADKIRLNLMPFAKHPVGSF